MQFANRRIRSFARRKCLANVAIHRHGLFGFETALELSEGGMLIRAQGHYKVGDRCTVNLLVPGGSFISTAAEVAYILDEPGGERQYGLRFLEPSTHVKIEIREFVTEPEAG